MGSWPWPQGLAPRHSVLLSGTVLWVTVDQTDKAIEHRNSCEAELDHGEGNLGQSSLCPVSEALSELSLLLAKAAN